MFNLKEVLPFLPSEDMMLHLASNIPYIFDIVKDFVKIAKKKRNRRILSTAIDDLGSCPNSAIAWLTKLNKSQYLNCSDQSMSKIKFQFENIFDISKIIIFVSIFENEIILIGYFRWRIFFQTQCRTSIENAGVSC